MSAASASTTCSGGAGIAQTGTSVTLRTGATIPANGSCTIGVDVAGVAAGTLEEFLKLTHLPEEPNKKLDAKGMIGALLNDHESIAQHLRQDLAAVEEKSGDVGTADFLTNLMQRHEKMAWMLRSYLK